MQVFKSKLWWIPTSCLKTRTFNMGNTRTTCISEYEHMQIYAPLPSHLQHEEALPCRTAASQPLNPQTISWTVTTCIWGKILCMPQSHATALTHYMALNKPSEDFPLQVGQTCPSMYSVCNSNLNLKGQMGLKWSRKTWRAEGLVHGCNQGKSKLLLWCGKVPPWISVKPSPVLKWDTSYLNLITNAKF